MTIDNLLKTISDALPEPPGARPELAGQATPDAPRCRRCGSLPEHLDEYTEAVADEHTCDPAEVTADDARAYVRAEEGTYNRDTGGFYCTACYIAIGQPNGKAP